MLYWLCFYYQSFYAIMLLSLSIFMFYSVSFVVTAEVIACSLNVISVWDLFCVPDADAGLYQWDDFYADAPLGSFAGSTLMSFYEFNSGTSTFSANVESKDYQQK